MLFNNSENILEIKYILHKTSVQTHGPPYFILFDCCLKVKQTVIAKVQRFLSLKSLKCHFNYEQASSVDLLQIASRGHSPFVIIITQLGHNYYTVGTNALDTEAESTHGKQGPNAKQQFYYNTQEFFFFSAALIACQAHQHVDKGGGGWVGRQAGMRLPWNVLHEVCGWGGGDSSRSPPGVRRAERRSRVHLSSAVLI